MKNSQVTSGKGDQGQSLTLGGEKLPKSHALFEACGSLDLVRAHTAALRLELNDSIREDADWISDFLYWLLHVYFLIGTECNDPACKNPGVRKGNLSEKHLDKLEKFQQTLEDQVTLPRYFILSASNAHSAQWDILCTEVRGLERDLVRLKESVPEFDAEHIFSFVNRLSDTFYMLARKLEDGQHIAVDYDLIDQ
jgi:ATP:cob(I)alamin adenosyltransferase